MQYDHYLCAQWEPQNVSIDPCRSHLIHQRAAATSGRKKHSVQKKITHLAKSTQEIFEKYPYLMGSVAKDKGGNISLIPPNSPLLGLLFFLF